MIAKKQIPTENITTLQQHCNKRATICKKIPLFEIKELIYSIIKNNYIVLYVYIY